MTRPATQAGWIGVLGGKSLQRRFPHALYIEELFAQAGLLNWRWLDGPGEADDSVAALEIEAASPLAGATVAVGQSRQQADLARTCRLRIPLA
jgi:hypothetical protein